MKYLSASCSHLINAGCPNCNAGQQISAALNGYTGEIELSVIGYLVDGQAFAGSHTARVKQ